MCEPVCAGFAAKYVLGALGVAVDVILFADMRAHKPLQPVAPSLTYPAGQSSHLKDPTVLSHLRLLSQPPLFVAHSSTSKRTGLCECSCVCFTTAIFISYHHGRNEADVAET